MSRAPTLQEIDQVHDTEPTQAAEGLQALAQQGVLADELPRFCWLVNHVIGEKLGRWHEACSLLQATVTGAEDLRSLCHLAVAAHLAGDPVLAWRTADRLHEEALVTRPVTDCLIRLSTLQFAASSLATAPFCALLDSCVEQLAEETGLAHSGDGDDLGELGKPLAAALNNVVSLLLDHPDASAADTAYRRSLLDGARVARTLWQRVGTWLNDERANYLVALCANRVEDWPAAQLAAEGALDTIRKNGAEEVDRAFILLELARALAAQGLPSEAETARNTAQALARDFDGDLREWFEQRAG